MLEAITSLLTSDATMTSLLDGGIYNHSVVGEISVQATPNVFDNTNRQLLPCLLVTGSSATFSTGQGVRGAETFITSLYFYQWDRYGVIDQARVRARLLLHDQIIIPANSDDTAWQTVWANDVLYQEDPTLECKLHVSNFTTMVNRNAANYIC